MTTIATDGKSMAGDGLECQADTITGHAVQKVHRLSDGRIVGIAGQFVDAIAFLEWLGGGPKPKVKCLAALVLHPGGEVDWYDNNLQPLRSEVPAAIGSGMDFALAAMDAGASPEQTVTIAAGRDTNTGGTITSLERTLRAVA